MPPLLIGGCSTDIIARNSPPIKLSANPSYGKEPIKRRLDFKHSPLWKYLPRKVFFLCYHAVPLVVSRSNSSYSYVEAVCDAE